MNDSKLERPVNVACRYAKMSLHAHRQRQL